jgi:hypothetical protein
MSKAMLRLFGAFLAMTLFQRAGEVCKEKGIAKQESVKKLRVRENLF